MQYSGSLLTRLASASIRRNMSTKINLRGVFPPVASAFNDDESISYQRMEENFQRWNKINFAGYVLHGSNGESIYMNFEERVEMIKIIKSWIPEGKKLLVGAGCESTNQTIVLGTEAAKMGADALLVLTPCYYKNKMTPRALLKHFHAVADACPVPVIVYNVPGFTGVDMSAELVIELARHPNIVGMKESSANLVKISSIVHQTKGLDFQVLAGSASFMYAAYALGCTGAVPALGNCLGTAVCQLDSLYREGKMNEALELQRRLIEPNTCVTGKFGVPGLKKAMSWFGFYGGPCRSPLLPLETSEEEALRKAFVDNGFL